MCKLKEWFMKLWLKLFSKKLSFDISIPNLLTEEEKEEIIKKVKKNVEEATETKCTCRDDCKCEDSTQKKAKTTKPRKKKTTTKKAKE